MVFGPKPKKLQPLLLASVGQVLPTNQMHLQVATHFLPGVWGRNEKDVFWEIDMSLQKTQKIWSPQKM